MVFARYLLLEYPHGINTRQHQVNFYDLSMESITGEQISFADFREQALLVVNLASQ